MVALVTSANFYIGNLISKELAINGYKVYACARDIKLLNSLSKVDNIVIMELDLSNEKSIKKAMATVSKKEKCIDILVNSAGFGVYSDFENTSVENLKLQFDINFFGIFSLVKKVLPCMITSRNGKIINIPFIGGKIISKVDYFHPTKNILEYLSNLLRSNFKKYNIKVIFIELYSNNSQFLDSLEEYDIISSIDGIYEPVNKEDYINMFSSTRKDNYINDLSSTSKEALMLKSIVNKVISKNKPKKKYIIKDSKKTIFRLLSSIKDRITV